MFFFRSVISQITSSAPNPPAGITPVILISKAFLLDAEGNVQEDIYNKVQAKDDNYLSAKDGQYIRVVFEKPLKNHNDITLFARSDSGSVIHVYSVHDGKLIATFKNIASPSVYKVSLASLTAPDTTFDLRITGNVDVDYIVDPPSWTETQPAGDVDRNWEAGASSASGKWLIAGSTGGGGRLYISDDYGATWEEVQPAGNVDKDWIAAAINSSGQYMAASYHDGAGEGRMYVSNNYGATWTEAQPAGDTLAYWIAIGISADGSRLIAAASQIPPAMGRLYISSNYGVSWSETQPAGNETRQWQTADISGDGTRLIAGVYGGRLYRSSNFGSSWSETQPRGDADYYWARAILDADGSHAVVNVSNADPNGASLHTSSNYGATWTEISSPPCATCFALADSTDGAYLLIGDSGVSGRLYTSTDQGANWTETQPAGNVSLDWRVAGSNASGSRLLAGVTASGRLYVGVKVAYWVGGTGNWSDAANHWASSSGGVAGSANLPDASTIVYFDSNSGTGTVTVNSSVSIAGFNSTSSNITVSLGSNTMNVSGNWNNSGGVFNGGTGTVNLNGTDQTISGTTTFYNLTKSVTAADTLTFTDGTTQTVSNAVTLNGASGQLLTLAGTSTGGWTISMPSTQTLSYLSVSYSTATTNTANAGATSTDAGNNTNWNFANTAPSFSVTPSDGGALSRPTDVGSNVSFTATATDSQSNNYYVAFCKTNSITANSNAAPTCPGGNWCISSSTAAGSQASCTYTALSGDAETNAWYAFVCDHHGSSLCSSSSQGGVGNNGSPFEVNHRPAFTSLSVTGGTINVGGSAVFTTVSSDPDSGWPDTVTLYVCKANDFTGTACGGGGEWCHSSASSSNPTCSYTVQSSDPSGTNSYYGFIIDNHNFASLANPLSGTMSFSTSSGGGGGGGPGWPPSPPCTSNAECGADGFTGSPFCQNGDPYQNYTTYTCNAGACSSSSVPQQRQTCSTNPGATWENIAPPNASGGQISNFNKLAASTDGKRIVVSQWSGRLYVSSDTGATWKEARPAGNVDKNWGSVVSSADGMRLVVSTADWNQQLFKWTSTVYVSSDAGSTWTLLDASGSGIPQNDLSVVSSSADGSRLMGMSMNTNAWPRDVIYLSSDYGATWRIVHPSGNQWQAFGLGVSDATGMRLLASTAAPNGRLYQSSDGGNSWREVQPAGNVDKYWYALASSPNGKNLLVGDYMSPNKLYLSSDYGSTWTVLPESGGAAWMGLALSPDGSKMLAGGAYSLHFSSNSGTSWTQVTEQQLGNTLSSSQVFGSTYISADSSVMLVAAERGLYIYRGPNNNCVTLSCAPGTCSTNADCGTDGLTGNPFCQGGSPYQNYTSYICNNPGTSSAACVSSTVAQPQQACSATVTTNCVSLTCTVQHSICNAARQCVVVNGAGIDQCQTSADCVNLCGNGMRNTGEACDDGNTANGDGCSSVCQVESGWQCSPEPEPNSQTYNVRAAEDLAATSDGSIWTYGNPYLHYPMTVIRANGNVEQVDSRPASMVGGVDGNLWFASLENNTSILGIVGYLNPTTFAPTTFNNGAFSDYGSFDTLVTPGPDGNMWYLSKPVYPQPPSDLITVVRVTPTGTVTGQFTHPDLLTYQDVTAPNTPAMPFITAAGDYVWVGAGKNMFRVDPSTGDITKFSAFPLVGREGHIAFLTADPSNNVWFTNYNHSGKRVIGKITSGGVITIWPSNPLESLEGVEVPSGNVYPLYYGTTRDMVFGPDGNLWVTNDNSSWRVTEVAGQLAISVYPNLYGYHNVIGADGNLWISTGSTVRKVILSSSGASSGGGSGGQPIGDICTRIQQHTACNAQLQCVVVPGSGVNECQTNNDCANQSHGVCNSQQQCVQVQGPGANQCQAASDCANLEHTECRNNQCITVSGAGVNQCIGNGQCAVAIHNACNSLNQCVVVQGPGVNSCQVNLDCNALAHTECSNNQCVVVPGAGTNQCLNDQACQNPVHNVCNAQRQCIVVNGVGSNQCTGDSDCSVFQMHNICNAQKQCIAVSGAGFNECLSSGQCENPPTHNECRNNQCISVSGPGVNQCSADADCGISPVHNVCNAQKQCVVVQGTGFNQCQTNGDCATATYTQCSNNQCITVNGVGTSQCRTSFDCAITQKHNECNAQKQCISVDGAGFNQCQTSGDCSATHTQCNSQKQCVRVQGVGVNQCQDDGECLACVAP